MYPKNPPPALMKIKNILCQEISITVKPAKLAILVTWDFCKLDNFIKNQTNLQNTLKALR